MLVLKSKYAQCFNHLIYIDISEYIYYDNIRSIVIGL